MKSANKTQDELSKFLIVRQEGNRNVNRHLNHYNLDP